MTLVPLRLVTVLLLAGAVSAMAETPLQESRSTLDKWVETRQLISRTRTDWAEAKEMLGQEISFLERTLKSLDEQFAHLNATNTLAGVEFEKVLAEEKTLTNGLDRVATLAAGLEKKVLALVPAFPPPLAARSDFQALLKRIPADPSTRLSPIERMQTVVALLSEVDKFNAAVSVVGEIQKTPSGAEVQVETIYVGLGQAYFVDKTGDYAGVGVPTAEGWRWTPRKELAGRIQKALAVYKNSAPAAFVNLPVEIQ